MFVRLVGFFLVAMAFSVTTYSLIQRAVPYAQSRPKMSSEAKKYLDHVLTLFREQHINAAKMNWPELTREAYGVADGAETTADTYPAIWFIIKSLGEKHTLFLDPDQATAEATGKPSGGAKPPPFVLPTATRLANGIGVIRLPGFVGSRDEGKLYTQTAQSQISVMKAHGVCRYVLDLSDDTGGNMYPMLNGVTGLLEPGVLGTFLFPDGKYAPWAFAGGVVTEQPAQNTLPIATRTSVTLPVAVLIGSKTGSAGEFTAMSFEGREKTRFFGSPSAGFVTANTPITLSDGAVLVMTGAWGLDRTGKKYVGRIEPDENTGSGGAALEAAVNWLAHQPCNAS